MPIVHNNLRVPRPPQQMYNLVNDVEKYPEFVPWCSKAVIKQQDAQSMDVSLTFGAGGLSYSFTTRNTLTPGQTIKVDLLDGPFNSLTGAWQFLAVPGETEQCDVLLDLSFTFNNSMVAKLFEPIFTQVSKQLVETFKARAETRREDPS